MKIQQKINVGAISRAQPFLKAGSKIITFCSLHFGLSDTLVKNLIYGKYIFV